MKQELIAQASEPVHQMEIAYVLSERPKRIAVANMGED